MKIIITIVTFLASILLVNWYNLNNQDYLKINNFWYQINKYTNWNNKLLTNIKNKIEVILKSKNINEIKKTYYKEINKLIEVYIIFNNEKKLEGPFLVTKVIDWDTINIEQNNEKLTIRLIWIDAPESTITRYWYLQCWWKESTEYLKKLIENKFVYIEYDESQWIKDKYWRKLAYVRFEWTNINYHQIDSWNWSEYTYKKDYKYKKTFLLAEFYGKRLKKWMRSEICKLKNTITDSPTMNYTLENSNNCWTKRYCWEMSNCEEAYHYLTKCWLSRLDSDGDGIPCESICK